MHILNRIADQKKKEVAFKKKSVPISVLEKKAHFNRPGLSLSAALNSNSPGIIAEHKRRSPSDPAIRPASDLASVVRGYTKAGAAGLSILTDTLFFGGSLEDLNLARKLTDIPLLRKDFIIDPYQVIESKAEGADVILLIAAMLGKKEVSSLTHLAHDLDMQVLLEVHNAAELNDFFSSDIDMIGVNNRDLKTFEVHLETSMSLSELMPEETVRISESGISDIASIHTLHKAGYHGFLIGTHFMKQGDPAKAAGEFIQKLHHED